MPDASVSLVIVSWNCRQFLLNCLVSLQETCGWAEVIVVDNASQDGTAEMVRRQFPRVHLICCPTNLGFAKANNIGIEASSGEYVALVNPDVVLLPGCIDKAIEVMTHKPDIGLLGPRMVDERGETRRSGMRFPTLWHTLCDALTLGRVFPSLGVFGGQEMIGFNWQRACEVEVLNGWFWIVRRVALDSVGLLDERFFMYGEDLDWCKRFNSEGWKVWFEPSAAAIHYGGGSSRNAPVRFYVEMQKANLQYWRKHHAAPSRAAFVALQGVHHALRVLANGAMVAGGSRSPDAKHKMLRSWAFLRWLALGSRVEARGA